MNKTKTIVAYCFVAIVAVSVSGLPTSANAADQEPNAYYNAADRNFLRTLGDDFTHFITSRETAVFLGLGGSLGWLASTADQGIRDSRMNSEAHMGARRDALFEAGEIGGMTQVQVGGALATLAIGKLIKKDAVSTLGSELLRAQIVNGAVTLAIKRSVKRTRPDESNRLSFPSGHTSGSFASATVLQRRYGWKIGIPAYALASYVGASRINENKHYLSDVVVGAAIGLASGRAITRFGRRDGMSIKPQLIEGGPGVEVTIPLP